MFKGDRNFAVGLFVSIAIAAFIAFVIWLTGRSGVEEMRRYSLLFERDVSGLAVGGPVKYMGMNIGSVVQMQLKQGDVIRVRVDIEVLESTPVDGGTYASIALQGITGVAVVNLASEAGTFPPLGIEPGMEHPVIPVRDVGFAAVLSSMPEIMSKLDQLLSRAGELIGEDTRNSVTSTLGNVENLTASLAEQSEEIAAIPADLRETLSGIQDTTARLQSMLSDLQPGISGTVDHLETSSENLVRLTGRIDTLLADHQEDMSRFMDKGLGDFPGLMRETRMALRDLEKFMAELRDDPSQLIHRADIEEVQIAR